MPIPDNDDSRHLMYVAQHMGNPHLAEVYSQPRVSNLANRYGLTPAFSLDLTVLDEDDGKPWDFSQKDKRDKAKDLI